LRQAPRERGAAGPLGMLAVFLASTIVITIVMLFATGVAQRGILPRLQNRSSEALSVAPPSVLQAGQAAGDPAPTDRGPAAADSLRALLQQVRLEEQRMQEQVERLAAATDDIESARGVADRDAEERIAGLAKVYSSMKPQAAARVMVNLDDDTFKRVLDKLSVRQAAKVLAYVDPVRVARITQEAAASASDRADTGIQER